jgi:hypothetical protein
MPALANSLLSVSSRLDKSWSVLASHQTDEGNRCVDIFSRPDGTFGFEEFRRDPEDMGACIPISYFSGHLYPAEADAIAAAKHAIWWLGPLLEGAGPLTRVPINKGPEPDVPFRPPLTASDPTHVVGERDGMAHWCFEPL